MKFIKVFVVVLAICSLHLVKADAAVSSKPVSSFLQVRLPPPPPAPPFFHHGRRHRIVRSHRRLHIHLPPPPPAPPRP